MPIRCGPNRENSSCGGPDVISVTILPMNTGMVESRSATSRPAANKAANRPFACRAKCQKKATKSGGGSEQRKHCISSQQTGSADGASRRAMPLLIRGLED